MGSCDRTMHSGSLSRLLTEVVKNLGFPAYNMVLDFAPFVLNSNCICLNIVRVQLHLRLF